MCVCDERNGAARDFPCKVEKALAFLSLAVKERNKDGAYSLSFRVQQQQKKKIDEGKKKKKERRSFE